MWEWFFFTYFFFIDSTRRQFMASGDFEEFHFDSNDGDDYDDNDDANLANSWLGGTFFESWR